MQDDAEIKEEYILQLKQVDPYLKILRMMRSPSVQDVDAARALLKRMQEVLPKVQHSAVCGVATFLHFKLILLNLTCQSDLILVTTGSRSLMCWYAGI